MQVNPVLVYFFILCQCLIKKSDYENGVRLIWTALFLVKIWWKERQNVLFWKLRKSLSVNFRQILGELLKTLGDFETAWETWFSQNPHIKYIQLIFVKLLKHFCRVFFSPGMKLAVYPCCTRIFKPLVFTRYQDKKPPDINPPTKTPQAKNPPEQIL